MTTLDARARGAAHSIHAGIAEFTPAATFDVVVVRHQRWRTMQAGFAGAVAAAIIVLVGIAVAPSPAPEVAEVPVSGWQCMALLLTLAQIVLRRKQSWRFRTSVMMHTEHA